MDDLRPETLIARDPCVHKAGLLGKRGQLALYCDRMVFQGAGESRGRDLPIERVTHIRLRGRRRNAIEVALGGEVAAFKLDQAAARFRDLCALLVQRNPPMPGLDARFGDVDQSAAAALLTSHGLELASGERLELCEWALSWEGEELVRCGWLLLTSDRLIFLNAGETPKRTPPLAMRLDELQRLETGSDAEIHLHQAAQGSRLRFDPHSGSALTRAFWARCQAVVRPKDDEAVRSGQDLQQLAGPTPMSRLQLGDGSSLSLRDVTWRADGQQLRALVRFHEVQQVQAGTPCTVELIRRGGVFVFEGHLVAVLPVKDGPFKPSHAWLALVPSSDIRFVNRRRAFRVELSRPLHVLVATPDGRGGYEEPISTLFRLTDLSNIGCALVGPADIPLEARFTFELPLGPDERKLSLVAECIHARPTEGPPEVRHYGLQLLGLTEQDRDAIQVEVVLQERLQLRRRAMVR